MLPSIASCLISNLRTYYHAPQSARGRHKDETIEHYCVGGILGLYWSLGAKPESWESLFPKTQQLAEVLQQMNQKLTPHTGYLFATKIITHNDTADFETAWTILERALCYPAKTLNEWDKNDSTRS
jgi:hypothetical protein